MNKKIIKFATFLSEKLPFIAPYAFDFYHKNLLGAKFTGWGMKTEHELPWNDEYSGKVFRQTCKDVKKFEFSSSFRMKESTLDELKWRHWIVSTATLHALKFAKSNEYNFVECGVGDGLTSFFTLREISNYKLRKTNFSLHLYDAWAAMKKDYLLDSELGSEGKYAELDFERTKNNLSEFQEQIIFHHGYIPSTFNQPPESPNSINYLHIDLNATTPTIDALEFFLPKLVPGGVILFDDYGWAPYLDTKQAIDKFFSDKPGILLKLPTAQAIYYN